MNPSVARIEPLGTHELHIDGDTLVMIARGMLTAEDMKGLLEHFVRIKREQGRLFVLYNGYECTGLDAGARKLATAMRREDADSLLRVAFGVPFTVRVMLNMLIKAQKVLINRDIDMQLFEHEKEAREFFEKERARLRQQFKK